MATCVDCLALPEIERPKTSRPIHPDSTPRRPRCATHLRGAKRAQRVARAEKRSQKVYGLAPGQYDLLLAAQDGRCAICRIATGKARRLSVDHDHATGEVRGLLCTNCNRTVLGHDGEILRRALAYLADPPARALERAS